MDLLAMADDHGLDRVARSRASWWRDTTAIDGVIEVPVVGGRTVWESVENPAAVLFVVEEPNYFGRFETDPPYGAVVTRITHATTKGSPDANIGEVRHLAASLMQIPGLKLPHGQPESSWFVVSLPGSAESTARLLREDGFTTCVPLGRRFPEFPGGLHVQVAWPQQENSRFCTIVRSVG